MAFQLSTASLILSGLSDVVLDIHDWADARSE